MDKREKYFELIKSELLKGFSSAVKSIIIYGSAAGDRYVEKTSDINVLAVVKTAALEHARFSKPLNGLLRRGKVKILLFQENEFYNAMDVFQVEFNEIKRQHKIIFGENVIEQFEINFEQMRLQLERMARSNILKLRQGFFLTGGNAADLKGLMFSSVSSFLTILQNLLLLSKIEVEGDFSKYKTVLKDKLGLESGAIEDVYFMKYGRKIKHSELRPLFFLYYEQMGKIIEKINDL